MLMPLKNQTAAAMFKNNLQGKGGHYLLGANNHWHGGMHFSINAPVQAIADGKLIAFRIAKDYCKADLQFSQNNNKNQYSNSFALIKHACSIKSRTLNYYSLYMHLQPASEYEKDKSLIIPDYLRAIGDRPRDAIINKDEDKPSGLNIRDCKSGSIVTTAPIASLIDLDSSVIDPVEDKRFLSNKDSNDNYRKVSFTDHKGITHTGYALLDEERTKAVGDQFQITTLEDPLTGSARNELAGLKLRSAMNFSDDSILRFLKNGTPVKLNLENSQWAKVIEIDGCSPQEDCFLYHRDRVKFDEQDIDEDLLEDVFCPNQDIEAGAFIGLPSKNFEQKNCLHFEIFTDDSIKEFIKPHKNLPESDLTILQVKQGSTLFKREKVIVDKENDTSIAKLSRIVIESDGSDSEYVKVTATDHGIVFDRDNLGVYSSGSNEYSGIIEHLEEYQKQVGSLAVDSKIEFISYSTSSGLKCSEDESSKNRLTAFPIPSGDQKAYWVKRDAIETQDFGNKGSFLTKNITEVYLEQPDAYQFTKESSQGFSDDCYIELNECEQYKGGDGKNWFNVTLPFDDLGPYYPVSIKLGVNRPNKKQVWVQAEDTELTSPFNWPGFYLASTEGLGGKDAQIDFNNCSPFFTEIFKDIEIIKDDNAEYSEIQAALKKDILAERMSRIIAKHPSEWQSDENCSKWLHIKDVVNDDVAFEEAKKQITKLAWWDEAKAAGAELPAGPNVYHLHSLSFSHSMKLLIRLPYINYDNFYAYKGSAYSDDQIVDHSYYKHPINNINGRYTGNSRVAGDASKEVQRHVIDTIYNSAKNSGLSNRDICLLLSIARLESGFNPDAAAGTTSASGIGQFVKDTGIKYGLNSENVFEVQSNVDALIEIFIKEYIKGAERAGLKGENREIRIYALHHDGPSLKYGGEKIAKKRIIPWVDKIYASISWDD